MRRNFLTTIIALLVFVSVSANIPEYHSVKAVSAIKSDGTQTAVTSEETAFGRRLLERWKKAGVKLPMSEEKIKSLRPGKKKLNAEPEVELDPRISFTGFLQYSRVDGEMYLPYGFYKFSPATGLKRELYQNLHGCANGGGAYIGNQLHAVSNIYLDDEGTDISDGRSRYHVWDTDTWKELSVTYKNVWNIEMNGAAYDPIGKRVIGITFWGTLAEINYETMEALDIYSLSFFPVAIAIDNAGVAWILDEGGDLYSVDLSTGAETKIGSLDFEFMAALQSMTFDERTGKLYLAASEGDMSGEFYGRLCEVSLTDASTKLVGYFPEHEEYTVLNVVYAPDAKAPGAIADLTATYADASLNANISFTIPQTAYDGSTMSEDVNYSIYVNDAVEPVVTGIAKPGDAVLKNVTPTEGRSKFVVVLSNSYGEGDRNAIESWGGEDEPFIHKLDVTPNEVTNEITLNWDVSNVGKNGGYADMTGVTYSISRYPDDIVIAEGVTGTSYTDDLSNLDMKLYYYTVTPVKDGNYYTSTTSLQSFIGKPHNLPYYQDFENPACEYELMVQDNNNDGNTWDFQFDWYGRGLVWSLPDPKNDADDWLITPGFNFEKDYTYIIKFDASKYKEEYAERLEVGVGEGFDVSNYEIVMQPTYLTSIVQENEETTEIVFVCKKSGVYHVGFHSVSEANNLSLFLDNVSVEKGCQIYSPTASTNLKITPATEGELQATIEFDTPTTNQIGNTLAEITKVTLYRGETRDYVGEITNVQPGTHYSITDKDAMNGTILYTVVAANSYGEGTPATASAYVGIDTPLEPTETTITDNLDGTFTLSWKAPTQGINGGYIDESELLYNVYIAEDGAPVIIEEGIENLTYTVTGLEIPEEQSLLDLYITAGNDLGESGYAAVPLMIIGKAYDLPFVEGFGLDMKNWLASNVNSGTYLYTGSSTDNDNCTIGMQPSGPNAYGRLTSGKICIKNATNPRLAFSLLTYPGKDAQIGVNVSRNGAAPEQILSIDYEKLDGETGFRTLLADLSKYIDTEYILISIDITINDMEACPVVLIDDFNVLDMNAYDLEITAELQGKVPAGDSAMLDLTVRNIGQNEVAEYDVNIFVNDQLVESINSAASIIPLERNVINYSINTAPIMAGNVNVRVEIAYESDLALDNNTFNGILKVCEPLLSKVNKLKAEEKEGMSVVTWEAPEYSDVVFDSFETYQPFAYNGFGDWKVVDMDNCASMPVISAEYPGNYDPAAFFVVDFVSLGYDETEIGDFKGSTGNSFMSCVINDSYFNDDWVISPELSGNAQTITFQAQSLNFGYEEYFQVLYSTESTNIDEFNYIASYNVENGYQEISFDVPEGAKYFAIHSTSYYGGMLMIDDVTYEGNPLVLEGYNVYRQGEKVAYVEAATTMFTEPLTGGDMVYTVTAVYNKGESAPCEPATISGIENIIESGISVMTIPGHIVITGAEGKNVTVCSLDGKVIFNEIANEEEIISVECGIYITKIGEEAMKVVVK